MFKLGKPQPYHLSSQNNFVGNNGTQKRGQGYLTTAELTKIIIPLSGCHAQIDDYVNFVLWYRAGEVTVVDCRIAVKELMIFALPRISAVSRNYGYLEKADGVTRDAEQYHLNALIESEIAEILATPITDASLQMILNQIRTSEVASEVERKRVQNYRISRPNQAKFRHDVLAACQRCIITNVTMPEVLEAAHIKPFKYNGEDTVANGFAMRTDIHTLFDAGHLRISETGVSRTVYKSTDGLWRCYSSENCSPRLHQS